MPTKNQDLANSTPLEDDASRDTGVTRRDVLKASASAAALAGASTLLPTPAMASGGSGQHPVFGMSRADRRVVAFNLRTDTAAFYLNPPASGPAVQPVSGDEGLYADFRGSFSKTLKHNNMGEVTPNSYNAYLDALESGAPADFENIPVGRENDPNRVRLVSPQAAYAFEMFGVDGNDPRMDAAPTFASAETAAEMGELYWYALTRDVPFSRYDQAPIIARAASDLNAFSRSDIFPNDGGAVTPGTIFRGTLPGSSIGPFVSQFLLQPFDFGRLQFDGRYDRPTPGGVNDFMTDYSEWLRIQRGAAPSESTTFSGQKRFISSMRALSEFVHVDFPIQAGLYCAFYLLSFGEGALAANNPYLRSASNTQQGFADFGPADITHLVTHGPRLGLTGAWYQKWLAHRRLRPEVFGGRINRNLRGLRAYDINQEIFDSEALARIIAANETGNADNDGLLPMGYPEGSPAHPAYPGGHSTFIAAAATILKAWFNEDFVIPNPMVANAQGTALLPWTGAPLTVGNELNKLVGNITHGRDGAGMHWRSDGRGNFIGERQALGVLLDYSRTYNEDFDGFELTLFSGQKVNIRDGQITPI